MKIKDFSSQGEVSAFPNWVDIIPNKKLKKLKFHLAYVAILGISIQFLEISRIAYRCILQESSI